MAKVWIVVVLLIAQNIFAKADEENASQNCDACIRSGKSWCNKMTNQGHCFESTRDDACPDHDVDKLILHESTRTDGDIFQPNYAVKTLYLSSLHSQPMSITYTSTKKGNVTIDFLNTNQNPYITVEQEGETQCDGIRCKVNIQAKALKGFCSSDYEFVEVAIRVEGISEFAKVRYYVPCACECTNKNKTRAKECNYNGNYTCGICTCDGDWTGERCEQRCDRGDISQGCMAHDSSSECYGNGMCVCGDCECFNSGPGSQYFDSLEKCSSLCTQTIECSACLRDGNLGQCDNTQCESRDIIVEALNETAITERDPKNRTIWIHCTEHADDYDFDYYTKRIEYTYFVMIRSNGNSAGAGAVAAGPGTIGGGGGATSSKVPLILGILAAVAAITAVGGFLVWKHMHALPALPASDPGYAHMDAEDCTGENPLYIPPTSSFKNPTFGKW